MHTNLLLRSVGSLGRSLSAKRPINAGASLARLARIGGANLVSSQELNGRALAQEAQNVGSTMGSGQCVGFDAQYRTISHDC